jgi:hypothetical protein
MIMGSFGRYLTISVHDHGTAARGLRIDRRSTLRRRVRARIGVDQPERLGLLLRLQVAFMLAG